MVTMKNKIKNAVIYVRTATPSPEQYGIGLQTTESMDFAKANNYNVLKVFTDNGETGSNLNRPAMHAMIEYCKASNNVDAVIVWKWNRMFSNFADYRMILSSFFQKNNIKLLSATENNGETPEGNLMRDIVIYLAGYKSKLLSK